MFDFYVHGVILFDFSREWVRGKVRGLSLKLLSNANLRMFKLLWVYYWAYWSIVFNLGALSTAKFGGR